MASAGAQARTVGVSPCAVTYSGQALYVTDLSFAPMFAGDAAVVRHIATSSGALTTIAGNGTTSTDFDLRALPAVPDGASATSAALTDSCGVAVDHSGNVLVADSTDFEDADDVVVPYGIRVVAGATGKFYGRHLVKGREYTLVRSSDPRLRGDGPGAIAVDSAGNVLFTGDDDEIYARAVRTGTFYGVEMTAGGIFRIAGGGRSFANGALATQASLAFVSDEHFDGVADAGLRIDHHGNLVVADEYNGLVRVIAAGNGRFYGQSMRTGHIYTIAGDPAASPAKSPDGGLATKTGLFDPAELAIDHQGNVLMDNGIWVEALAESNGRFYGRAMVRGHLYKIVGSQQGPGGNGVAASKAGPVSPHALSVDGSGNVVIGTRNGVDVVPARTGEYYGEHMSAMHLYFLTYSQPDARTVVDSGDGGVATRAELNIEQSDFDPSTDLLATDKSADLFVADGGAVDLIAGTTRVRFGQQVQAGHLYRVAGNGEAGPLASGALARDTGLGRLVAGIGTDAAGNVLIADSTAHQVLVAAASTGTFYGQHMTAGHIYMIAGDTETGETGDGGPALQAEVGTPEGAGTDASGDVLIATNCEVRVVAAVAGTRYGQAMSAGHIYTISGTSTCSDAPDGSLAGSASLTKVSMVAVDAHGNVLLTDSTGIRVIAASTGTFYGQAMTAGDLYTVRAGATGGGFAVDGAGNLVVADALTSAILVLAETTGTFYGVPMTAGQTYQIAGSGFVGHSGDGGPATKAALADPVSVVALADGSVADAEFHWIRKITGA